MSLQTATQLQLSLVKVNSNIYDLRAANGSTIQIEYKVDIGIKIDKDRPIANISCLVSSQLNSSDLIISWETMAKWNILTLQKTSCSGNYRDIVPQVFLMGENSAVNIPKANADFLLNPPDLIEFPEIPKDDKNWKELVTKQGQEMKEKLLENYPLAFGNSDSEVLQYAAVEPIKISVNPGAKPINRSSGPRVPPGMESSSKDLIDTLLKQGGIKRHEKPSTWCASARFVPKSSGQPRLVVNFTGLNSCGDKIGYPFSSVQDIHAEIKEGTLLFICLDLINSFFQLRIHEDSQHLLCFVCPYGKFIMTRVPQGWISSMDHLNINTRVLLAGVDCSCKIVDDSLLMPKSASEAYFMAAKVLLAAISKNFRFSSEKIIIFPSVIFAGLALETFPNGEVSILPDPKRVENLSNLPTPDTKERVLCILGLLATLAKWIPSLSIQTDPLAPKAQQ